MGPSFSLFQASVPFLYPLKTSGNHIGFLIFPWGIEMEHWLEVSSVIFKKLFDECFPNQFSAILKKKLSCTTREQLPVMVSPAW